MPNNPIGQSAINHLRRYGVDTQFVARGGDRLGIYFLETGASMRASQVVYDRAGASIAEVDASEFDFDKIFDGASWFHTTGITPALSDKAAALTLAALKAAKAKGITTSIDLNFRKKLWTKEKARVVMTELCEFVDVCIGNEEDADLCLGFKAADTDVTKGELNLDGFKEVFQQMKAKFGFKFIASSLRESHSASDNGWSALVYDGNEYSWGGSGGLDYGQSIDIDVHFSPNTITSTSDGFRYIGKGATAGNVTSVIYLPFSAATVEFTVARGVTGGNTSVFYRAYGQTGGSGGSFVL